MKKVKKIKRTHATYNRKIFLAPNSITSMSAIHTKIKEDGIATIRLSDCNNFIRWWNDLNCQKGVTEMLQKIDSSVEMLIAMRKEVEVKLKHNQ